MGLLGSIFSKQRVQLIVNNNTVIQLDASIKEIHGRESPPTEFPVENGTVISDHVMIKPFNLELTGVISDTPVGDTQGLITEVATSFTSALTPPVGLVAASAGYALFSALSESEAPSVVAYNQLLNLQASAQPVDVWTSLYRYPNMWISSISAPRDAETGRVLIFTVKLVQLILVQPQSVNIQVFANPALSANKADAGSSTVGLKEAQQGFAQGKDFAYKGG